MNYKSFSLKSLGEIKTLIYPENVIETNLESDAILVFTDFKSQRPLVIDVNTSLIEAQNFMRKANVRLKVVVNKDGEIVGTLTLNDLNGEKLQKKIGEGVSRQDINVSDIMTPQSQLKSIEYRLIKNAKVGDIIETLKNEHVPHFLVLDEVQPKIRGLFSAGQMARRLNVPMDIIGAPTFADVSRFVGNGF